MTPKKPRPNCRPRKPRHLRAALLGRRCTPIAAAITTAAGAAEEEVEEEVRPQKQPRRIFLVGLGGRDAGAVCLAGDHVGKAVQCNHGVARLQWNCATCTVAALDAEWTWHRPRDMGVALLQLAFHPSREVFCVRLKTADALAPGLQRLFQRAARGEVALVGFALDEDALRLRLGHGISLRKARCLDIQPWLSKESGRPKGISISLKDAVARHLGACIDKGAQLSDWEGPLTHTQLRYAAADAWCTLQLFARMPSSLLPLAPSLADLCWPTPARLKRPAQAR